MTDPFWDLFHRAGSLESKFDSKLILAMSATEYLASKKYEEKKLSDYFVYGVHYLGTDKDGFLRAVPRDAEVVVEYQSSVIVFPSFLFVDVCFDRYGVALIPRPR